MSNGLTDGIVWHNPQLEADYGEQSGKTGDDLICYLTGRAYQRGMQHKMQTGLQQRLRWAYNYLISDRPTHIEFLSKNEDSSLECEDGECSEEPVSVNLDFLGQQYNIAMSIYLDALKHRGSDYVTVKPTPIVDVSEASEERIKRSSFNSIVREIITQSIASVEDPAEQDAVALQVVHNLMGTDDGLAQVDEFIARQKQIEVSRKSAEGNVKARNAKRLIDDKLTESNYDQVILKGGAHSLWYDYGVIRAPFKVARKTTKVNDSGNLVQKEEDMWWMENIHPLNHFFAENSQYDEMGDYEGDLTWLSRSDLDKLSSMSGGQEKNIQGVLDDFQRHLRPSSNSETEEEYDSTWEHQDRIPVVRVLIHLDKETLKKAFEGETVEDESMLAEFWCTEDKVLFKKLDPRYLDYNPYRKNSYKIKDLNDIPSGRGIYSICRSAQELIDNSAIAMFENLQSLPDYITEINKGKVDHPEDIEEDLSAARPIVYTNSTGYKADFGGNDRALHIIGVPDNIGTFVASMNNGIQIMQQLGFSPFALGQGNFSGVRSTGQAAILQKNAGKDFGRFLQEQERLMETPVAEYIWTAEAIQTKDKSITVDSQIVVQSYSGFLQREAQAENLGLYMQNIGAIMDRRTAMLQTGQNVSWLDQLIVQYVEANGFSSDSFNLTQDVGTLTDQPGVQQDIVNDIGVQLDGRNQVPQDINAVL